MSFINKFLDLTETIPRQLVRLLKLLKVADERYNDLKFSLQKRREQYLQSLREKTSKKNITLKSLKLLQKELLSISDYKLEVIKEIKFIIESQFLNKLSPIIQEGKNEVEEQLSNSSNKINIPIPFSNTHNHNHNHNKLLYFDEDKKISETKAIDTEETTVNNCNKLLSKKKHRPKHIKKNKEDLSSESSNKILEDIKLDVYCKCKKESYGKMIQCENPDCGEWFHYECIGIKEGNEPEEWYCSEKCKENVKKMKKKLPKLK
jgi:predicted nucleic acid-binding Zn ribbon protein